MNVLATLNELARQFPWEYLVGAGVISPIGVAIKRAVELESRQKYSFLGFIKFTGEQVMYLIVLGMSSAAVAVNYLLHVPTTSPKVMAAQTAVLAFATQPVYFFIVKPFLNFFQKEVEKAALLNAEVKTAVVSPTAATTEAPVIKDFTN